MSEKREAPDPYWIVLFPVAMASLFALIGGYFTVSYQAKLALSQKQYEDRSRAYNAFIVRVDSTHSPDTAELLHLGSMAQHVATDAEIQELEDALEKLITRVLAHQVYWQLNSEFNMLRLYGSDRVYQYCDDLLILLALRDCEINWAIYPESIKAYYDKWRFAADNGNAYGWNPKISDDERVMIVMVSKIFEYLVLQLRAELGHGNGQCMRDRVQ